MEPKLLDGSHGKRMECGRYVYARDKCKAVGINFRTYWYCIHLHKFNCRSRVTTQELSPGHLVVIKDPTKHTCTTVSKLEKINNCTLRHQRVPSRVARPFGINSRVVNSNSQPSIREARISAISTRPLVRPANSKDDNAPKDGPQLLYDIKDLPDRLKSVTIKDKFLIYDSRGDKNFVGGKVLVFATKRNLEELALSEVWCVDGSSKISVGNSVTTSTLVLTISGSRYRVSHGNSRFSKELVSVPLVYALLSDSDRKNYAAVFYAIVSIGQSDCGIRPFAPKRIASDFEGPIMEACTEVFPNVKLTGCFYLLGPWLHRQLRKGGLQARFEDLKSSVRKYTRMLIALAFVPKKDVTKLFHQLKNESPEELRSIMNYFERSFINELPTGLRERGLNQAEATCYGLSFWNVYEAVLSGEHRTNNASERWHDNFSISLMKQSYPNLYSVIEAFQKQQARIDELRLDQLYSGKIAELFPTVFNCASWHKYQDRLRDIVEKYRTVYSTNGLAYLSELCNETRF